MWRRNKRENGKRLPENIVRGLNFVDAVLSGSLYIVQGVSGNQVRGDGLQHLR